MNARDALFWALWDNYRQAEKNQFIDAYRDEVALEIGRDALRDGLLTTLIRLVGEANAARLLADRRDASATDEGRTPECARDAVVNGLTEHACCFSEEDAKRMVNALMHEAAERLRDERPQYNPDWQCWGDAADRIDPPKDAT